MISEYELKKLLHYNPETGIFKWIVSPAHAVKAGSIAGRLHKFGYIEIRIKNKIYPAHRLAWFYVYGKWPKDQIDHINGIRDDNRIANLRECTNTENQQNRVSRKGSTSKYLGVSWDSKNERWLAQININNKNKYLGSYATEEDAYKAYCKAKAELHTFNPTIRNSVPLQSSKSEAVNDAKIVDLRELV